MFAITQVFIKILNMSHFDIKFTFCFVLLISHPSFGWSLESKTSSSSSFSTSEELTVSNHNTSDTKGFDWDSWSFGVSGGRSPSAGSDLNSRETGSSFGFGFSYDQILVIDSSASTSKVPAQKMINTSFDIGIAYKIIHGDMDKKEKEDDSFTPKTTLYVRSGLNTFGQDTVANLVLGQRSSTMGVKLQPISNWSFDFKYISSLLSGSV